MFSVIMTLYCILKLFAEYWENSRQACGKLKKYFLCSEGLLLTVVLPQNIDYWHCAQEQSAWTNAPLMSCVFMSILTTCDSKRRQSWRLKSFDSTECPVPANEWMHADGTWREYEPRKYVNEYYIQTGLNYVLLLRIESIIKTIIPFQMEVWRYILYTSACTRTLVFVWTSVLNIATEHRGRKSIPIRMPIKSDYKWLLSVGERWPVLSCHWINDINKCFPFSS